MWEAVCLGGRIWEAMGGCAPWLALRSDLSYPIRGARPPTRPPTASHSLPNSASQAHGLPSTRPPKFGLSSTRLPTFCHVICLSQSRSTASHESPIGLYSTGQSNAFRHEISQTGPRIGLPRPVESDRHLRLRTPTASQIGRPICEANLWGRGSPICSERPCSDSHSLTDLRVRSVRPWESEVRSDSSGQGNAFSHEIS